MWCIELGVSEGGGWIGFEEEAVRRWALPAMTGQGAHGRKKGHPACEGWQGNVAGGNGFSQSTETEERSLGAALPHWAARLPWLWYGYGDTHCVCLSLFLRRCWQICPKDAKVVGCYFEPFLTGIDWHWHFGSELNSDMSSENDSPRLWNQIKVLA